MAICRGVDDHLLPQQARRRGADGLWQSEGAVAQSEEEKAMGGVVRRGWACGTVGCRPHGFCAQYDRIVPEITCRVHHVALHAHQIKHRHAISFAPHAQVDCSIACLTYTRLAGPTHTSPTLCPTHPHTTTHISSATPPTEAPRPAHPCTLILAPSPHHIASMHM